MKTNLSGLRFNHARVCRSVALVRYLPITALVLMLGALAPLHAQSLDINANDDAMRVTYASFTGKNVITDAGAMFIDKGGDSETAWHLGVNGVMENVRLGMRTLYTSPGTYDLLAMGFGGNVNLYLSRQVKLGLLAYYAPSFSSFMDSDGYTEFDLRFSFKVNRKLDLYLGYRNVKVKLEGSSRKVELDDDLHIGIKMYF